MSRSHICYERRMRKDDSNRKSFFRSKDRVFVANGRWWFATREGDHGPFSTRQAAQDALTRFVLDVRGDIELNEVSILDRDDDTDSGSAWDSRPDVIR